MRRSVHLDQLIDHYLYHLADLRRSEATIRWHRYHLGNFGRWAMQEASSPSPTLWKGDDLLLVRRYLTIIGSKRTSRGTVVSAAYLKSVRSSLRSFCRWLVETGRLDVDLLAGTSDPRLPQRLKSTFTPEEIQRLMGAIRVSSRRPLRDQALVRFMLDTGCRASEVCALRIDDIDWSERSALVTGKGNKQRYVFFSPGVAEAMRRYLVEEHPGRGSFFFTSIAGDPLTPSGLLSICERFGKQAGIHAHPHKFRHTFALTYLRAGGDVFSLQKRLGHATLAMSEHYARHLTEDLRREHQDHSPDEYFFRRGS